MPNTVLSFFVNSLMMGLLLATIVYCLKLNKRIKVLQDSRSELARIIREFDESTTRATQNINEIHVATNRISENIQMKIDKANYLANDLDMLIERGHKLTGKTDANPPRTNQTMSAQRSTPDPVQARGQTMAEPVAAESSPRRPLRMRSRAEQELISMLGGKKQTESGN